MTSAPPVKVRSSIDGTDRPVRFWAPDHARDKQTGKPTPLLVYLHSWSASYQRSEGMPEALAECRQRGWVFVAPDFRGPNRRPEACASDLAVQDVIDAVEYAKAHACVDERRIYVVGGSGGGHMALVMAHRAPKLWAGVSAWVPITDLAAWHRFCKPLKYKYYRDVELCCGGPPGAPGTAEQYRKRSPVFWLAAAKGLPIDINAGIRDGHGGASVPIDHSLNAYNVLAEANGHADRMLSADDVRFMTSKASIPKHLAAERQDEPGRQHKILFRRSAGLVRITIFDGGHRGDAAAAARWLARQVRPDRGSSATARAGDKSAAPTKESDGMATKLSRSEGTSPAVSRNGMVASSQPLAVQVGIEILQAGGNAVDAAIAVNAMLGLVEPMNCGIGGDLFAIVWDAKTQRLYGLNASGRSPYGISRQLLRRRGLRSIPKQGPLSWSVPGCVDGWEMLRRRFGTMTFEQILSPAARYGEEGFDVTPVIARGWREAADFEDADARETYAPGGKAPRAGERFKNPRLARTYRAIIEGGRDAFYRGAIARKIVAASKAKGGLFAMRDFEDHVSNWVEPVSTTYRGYTVWELPPNGQGIAALEMLNVLEGFDLAGLGHNSVEHLHLFVEAKKLAFENRARFYADPDFNDLPVAELISKEFGKKQRARIDRNRAASEIEPVDPKKLVHGDTVYLTVVDRDRNAVSLIQSIFFGWGSTIAPGDLGFMLQNRGSLFAMADDHLNRLEPHKRPFHTIIPAMVTKDGKPWLSFGVMGGDMQPQGHVQVLCNIIDFKMNVQEAGVAPRCRHDGSSTPAGYHMARGGSVHLERGIALAVAEGLKAKGHHVAGSSTSYGGYQAIRIDRQKGLLYGGSEPRKDGMAMGC